MKRRDHPLQPPRAGAPYFQVQARGEVWTMRAPSLHQVGLLSKMLTPEQGREALLLVLTASAAAESPLTVLRVLQDAGAEICELIGALVGIAWKDPVYALESPQPADLTRPEQLRAYGAAVYEELYEAGWPVGHVMLLALAIFEQINESAKLEGEVRERIRFFLPPKAAPSEGGSSSSSSTSDGGEGLSTS